MEPDTAWGAKEGKSIHKSYRRCMQIFIEIDIHMRIIHITGETQIRYAYLCLLSTSNIYILALKSFYLNASVPFCWKNGNRLMGYFQSV